MLKSLAAAGHTVFVSSHLMSEMAQTATRLVVIGRGRLIAYTTVEGSSPAPQPVPSSSVRRRRRVFDDHGPRARVLWAPGRDRAGQHPGNPHVRLMADLHLCGRRLGSAMTWRGLSAGRRLVRATGSLALLMSLLGAKLGANVGRRRATSGHIGPESWQLNGTLGDSWPCIATGPACMACKRSGVRIP